MKLRYSHVIMLIILVFSISSIKCAFQSDDRDAQIATMLAGHIAKNDFGNVELSLSLGRSPLNAHGEDGFTPLLKALSVYNKNNKNNKKIITFCLDYGDLDLTKVDAHDGGNALVWAIRKEVSLDIIQRILDKDRSLLNTLSWKGEDAKTPLHEAIYRKSWGVVDELLKYKPELSIEAGNGTTPFYEAVVAGKPELAKKLIVDSTDFNKKDSQKMTLLYRYAGKYPQSLQFNKEMFIFLLSQGASLAEKNAFEKDTVLHQVFKNMEGVYTDKKGTPKERHEIAVEIFGLLMAGSEYQDNIRNALLVATENGETPLHLALKLKDHTIAKKCLEIVQHSSDTFKKEFKSKVLRQLAGYYSPLHLVIMYEFEESVITQLLSLGADPLQNSANQWTPSGLSKHCQRGAVIIKTLEEAENVALQQKIEQEKAALKKPIQTPPVKVAPSKNYEKSTPSSTTLLSSVTGATVISGTSSLQASRSSKDKQSVIKSAPSNLGDQSQATTSGKEKDLALVLMGISLVIGIGYGIKKVITSNNKPTEDDDREERPAH